MDELARAARRQEGSGVTWSRYDSPLLFTGEGLGVRGLMKAFRYFALTPDPSPVNGRGGGG